MNKHQSESSVEEVSAETKTVKRKSGATYFIGALAVTILVLAVSLFSFVAKGQLSSSKTKGAGPYTVKTLPYQLEPLAAPGSDKEEEIETNKEAVPVFIDRRRLAEPLSGTGARTVVIGPGTKIMQNDGRNEYTCTIGFTARLENGESVAVTSGHCAHRDSMVYRAAGTLPIGRFVSWRSEVAHGLAKDASGFGIIRLNANVQGVNTLSMGQIIGTTLVKRRAKICHFGATTGLSCGEVDDISERAGTVEAVTAKGDSGAPVFVEIRSGTLRLAGILAGDETEGKRRMIFNPIKNVLEMIAATKAFGKLTIEAKP